MAPPPLTQREIVLSAVEVLLREQLPDIKVLRTPNYVLAGADMPYVLVMDGEDQVEPQASGQIDVRTACGIVLGIRARTQETLGTTINALMGRVRKVLGDETTLGGLVVSLDYQGAEEPIYSSDPGSGPQGQIALNYELWRVEDERDPYRRP